MKRKSMREFIRENRKEIFEIDGKHFSAPSIVEFEGFEGSKFSYRYDTLRCPKQGEYYLSGAIPKAYKAPNDLSTEYLIVKKEYEFRLKRVYVSLNGRQVSREFYLSM